MPIQCFLESFTKRFKQLLSLLSIAVLCCTVNGYAQPGQRIYEEQGAALKNFSIIDRIGMPLHSSEHMMAGTIFDDPITSPEKFEFGDAINFKRINNLGRIQTWSGSLVNRRYDFPDFEDVRCVDIVAYSQDESFVIIQARAQNHITYGTRDLILVLEVDNNSGNILTNTALYNNGGSGNKNNMYAMHGLYHMGELYICGYVAERLPF